MLESFYNINAITNLQGMTIVCNLILINWLKKKTHNTKTFVIVHPFTPAEHSFRMTLPSPLIIVFADREGP